MINIQRIILKPLRCLYENVAQLSLQKERLGTLWSASIYKRNLSFLIVPIRLNLSARKTESLVNVPQFGYRVALHQDPHPRLGPTLHSHPLLREP